MQSAIQPGVPLFLGYHAKRDCLHGPYIVHFLSVSISDSWRHSKEQSLFLHWTRRACFLGATWEVQILPRKWLSKLHSVLYSWTIQGKEISWSFENKRTKKYCPPQDFWPPGGTLEAHACMKKWAKILVVSTAKQSRVVSKIQVTWQIKAEGNLGNKHLRGNPASWHWTMSSPPSTGPVIKVNGSLSLSLRKQKTNLRAGCLNHGMIIRWKYHAKRSKMVIP